MPASLSWAICQDWDTVFVILSVIIVLMTPCTNTIVTSTCVCHLCCNTLKFYMSAFILNPFGMSLCCFVCAMCVQMCLFCLPLKVGSLWPADSCYFSSVISDTTAIEIHFRLNMCSNLFRDMHLLGMMLIVWWYCIQASFVSCREWKWRNVKNWRHQLSPHRFQYQLQLKTNSIL